MLAEPACTQCSSSKEFQADTVILTIQQNYSPRAGHVDLQLTVREALNSALDDELARDESVFILGEEVLTKPALWNLEQLLGQLATVTVIPTYERCAGGRLSRCIQGTSYQTTEIHLRAVSRLSCAITN